VVWAEGGRYPDLIIELLSDSTAQVDRTDKKSLYQNIFRTREYFWFSPITGEFEGFRLGSNRQYEAVATNEQGWRWSDELGLYLGIQEGWLRYFAPDGTLVLGPEETARREKKQAEQAAERAEQERQRAEQAERCVQQERQRAEQAERCVQAERTQVMQERQRAERLAQRLRELGVDPNDE
jgi:Uma2 family endonuclease